MSPVAAADPVRRSGPSRVPEPTGAVEGAWEPTAMSFANAIRGAFDQQPLWGLHIVSRPAGSLERRS